MVNGSSPYLTVHEAIEYLRLPSQSSLYKLIRRSRLPYCRLGRHYRFDRRELDAWLRGHDSALDQMRAFKAAERMRKKGA